MVAVSLTEQTGQSEQIHPPLPPGGVDLGVRDDQLDPAQTAPCQLAQEVGPERIDLGGTDIEAEDLAPLDGREAAS